MVIRPDSSSWRQPEALTHKVESLYALVDPVSSERQNLGELWAHWLPAGNQPTRTERHSVALAFPLFPWFCASEIL